MTQPSNYRAFDDSLLIPSPKDIDRPIQELQIALGSQIDWLDRSFGRSWRGVRKEDGFRRPIYYPEVFQGMDKDPLKLSPGNDNTKSYSFFRVHDPAVTNDFQQGEFSNFNQTVSLIFWVNLKKIDSTKNYNYISDLIREVKDVIRNTYFSGQNARIVMNEVYEDPFNVWQTYTLDTIDFQRLEYPHKGFRIQCQMFYLENCETP